MLRIAMILGSTRPGRRGEAVAKWAYELCRRRDDVEFELIDLAEINLPFLDEPVAATSGQYSHAHSKAWSAKIASFDGFIFVTPEYNHSTCPALKNAIDYLYFEWNNKAAGFISYGGAMGVRAVEHLRQILAAVQVATVRQQVGLSMNTDFKNFQEFTPAPGHEKEVGVMLDQLIAWSGALKPLRAPG